MASLSIILYDAYTFSSNIQQTYLFRSSALIPLKNLIKPLKHIMMTSHYLNQWWLDYRRIYASFGPNELNCPLFRAYSYQPSHCIKILKDGSDYISKWHLINQFYFAWWRRGTETLEQAVEQAVMLPVIWEALMLLIYQPLFAWWYRGVDNFVELLVLCDGIHRSPMDSPLKGPLRWSFGVSFLDSLNKLLNRKSDCRWFWTP